MNNAFWRLSMLAMCSAALMAQSAGNRNEPTNRVSQSVKSLADESAAPDDTSDDAQPALLNILTVIGDNILGVPCLDCLLGITAPTLGLPVPVGKIVRGRNYQIDAYLIDNTYTGPCTFTFAVRDIHKAVIVSTSQTLKETAKTAILVSGGVTIPTNAVVGLGSVTTAAVCGTSTTRSSSPVFVACVENPPFCAY